MFSHLILKETRLSDSLSTKERSKEASLRVLHALIELVAHSVVVAALLGAIWLIGQLVHWLWGTSDYVFFGRIRLRYIFDGADLAILVGFVVWGVYSVVAAYVRKPKIMTALIKNSAIHFAKVLRVYTVLALVGAGVVVVAQLSASLGHMLDFHQIGLSLFIFFSVLSLILLVSKPAVRAFETTAIRWIRAFKRIRAEWKAPAKIEQHSERRQH